MKIINLSAEPLWRLHTWIPHGLQADQIVFLPDACPGKSSLPTGTAVKIAQPDWRRFAVSDCGCGMRLLRSELAGGEITRQKWDALADILRANKGRLGDLGGGNHFLDALLPYDDGPAHFLIHTGSRDESGLVDDLVDSPAAFDTEFTRIVGWARDNRAAIHDAISRIFGRMELLLDLPHNTYEALPDGGAILRKGSVHVEAGALLVIPSHMSGDVVLGRATDKVRESLDSLSHGTGRKMSRSECKPLAERFDFEALRQSIISPRESPMLPSAPKGRMPIAILKNAWRYWKAMSSRKADTVSLPTWAIFDRRR
jgi:release factor H-coupled RctB family protein